MKKGSLKYYHNEKEEAIAVISVDSYTCMEHHSLKKAIVSMTTGIISTSLSVLAIILSFFFLLPGGISALLSISCGIVAIVFSTRSRSYGRAIAGLILGIIGISISAILLLIHAVLVFFFQFSFF